MDNKQKEGKSLLTRSNIYTRKGKWTLEEKKEIVAKNAARKESRDKIANKYGTNRETIYNWKLNYIGSANKKIDKCLYNYDDLIKENEKILLENKILKKANEILKKNIK